MTLQQATQTTNARNFWRSAFLLLLLATAGYLSRCYAGHLPLTIRKRTGDALWASCIFVLLALIRPKWSTLKIAGIALLISYSIEFSQLYHRPWIDHLRDSFLGRLILGTTFFWLDQLAYTLGVAAVASIDFLLLRCHKTTIV